jgi:hypothetical protein
LGEDFAKMLCFPKRTGGAAILLQTQGFFARLLKGDARLSDTPRSDVASAQRDLKKLSLPQLLRISSFAFEDVSCGSTQQSSHATFLKILEECLADAVASRAFGADSGMAALRGREPDASVAEKMLLIFGAHCRSATKSRSAWWSLSVGGKRCFLHLDSCSLHEKAPEGSVFCYDSTQSTHECLHWEVFLVSDVVAWVNDHAPMTRRVSMTPRVVGRVSLTPCGGRPSLTPHVAPSVLASLPTPCRKNSSVNNVTLRRPDSSRSSTPQVAALGIVSKARNNCSPGSTSSESEESSDADVLAESKSSANQTDPRLSDLPKLQSRLSAIRRLSSLSEADANSSEARAQTACLLENTIDLADELLHRLIGQQVQQFS